MRTYFLTLHRLVGLFVGAVFLIISSTGAILVFDHKLDEILNPTLLLSGGNGSHQPLDKIIDAANRFRDDGSKAKQLRFPRNSNGVYLVYFRPAEGAEYIERYVDPYTAAPLGERVWGTYATSFIYRLHYTLLMGKPGKTILGICGIFLVISVVSGLRLWWPRRFTGVIKRLRKRHSPGSLAFYLDWHKMIGTVAAISILLMVVSGLCMVFPQYVKPALLIKKPLDVFSNDQIKSTHLSLDRACAIAQEKFPGHTLKRVYLPQNSKGPLGVMLTGSGDIQRAFVWMDQYSGTVLRVRDPSRMGKGEKVFGWMFPIHSGSAFGMPGRIAVLLTGISTVVLCLSGQAIWWLKRKRHRPSRLPRVS